MLAKELPELGEREQLRIAAVIRCLVSTQAWLRMREEFGVPGTESGPVVAWVIDTIIRELRAGNTPTDVTEGARHIRLSATPVARHSIAVE